MAHDPVIVRTADPLDEDQELAADRIDGLGENGTGEAKAQWMKVLHGGVGTGTPTTDTTPFPVKTPGTGTGRASRRIDFTSGQRQNVSPSDDTFRGRVISNPGPVDMYVGHTVAVTASGSTQGHLIAAAGANGTWTIPGDYTGDVFVIAAATSGGYIVIQEI